MMSWTRSARWSHDAMDAQKPLEPAHRRGLLPEVPGVDEGDSRGIEGLEYRVWWTAADPVGAPPTPTAGRVRSEPHADHARAERCRAIP